MIWFLMLLILSALFIAAIWWKPSKSRPAQFASRFESPSILATPSFDPGRPQRDAILEEEIEIIASLIRKEEKERRHRAALERLESIKTGNE
jgi:hypothetical protein